jgi:ribosomal protein L12E/L44/L45/RPP1/RPP2
MEVIIAPIRTKIDENNVVIADLTKNNVE